MKVILLPLEDSVAAFYEQVAAASQFPLEQVLSDALFKLAAELSLEALRQERKKGT
ncbi:MAG: hypothetical protein J6V25_11900 [Oscillospiraceae bacterium]|nr:hypothetical protein [Oscillospiraceae bacterium]